MKSSSQSPEILCPYKLSRTKCPSSFVKFYHNYSPLSTQVIRYSSKYIFSPMTSYYNRTYLIRSGMYVDGE